MAYPDQVSLTEPFAIEGPETASVQPHRTAAQDSLEDFAIIDVHSPHTSLLVRTAFLKLSISTFIR